MTPFGGIAVDRFGGMRMIMMTAVPQAALMALLGVMDTTVWFVTVTVSLSSCFAFSGPVQFRPRQRS